MVIAEAVESRTVITFQTAFGVFPCLPELSLRTFFVRLTTQEPDHADLASLLCLISPMKSHAWEWKAWDIKLYD